MQHFQHLVVNKKSTRAKCECNFSPQAGTTLQTNIVCQCCLNTSCETLLQHKKISCAMFAQSAQSSFSRTTVAMLSSSAWVNIVHPQFTSNFTQENNLHYFLYLFTYPPAPHPPPSSPFFCNNEESDDSIENDIWLKCNNCNLWTHLHCIQHISE